MKFEEILEKYKRSGMNSNELIEAFSGFAPMFNNMKDKDKKAFENAIKKFHEKAEGPHFNEDYAETQVKDMYHTKRNGSICRGEMFTEDEARRIYDREVRRLGGNYTVWDVYVALNAQYHDYCKLFKEWFGDGNDEKIKEKIAESAVAFWFEDEDANKGKVWKYFEDKE